jgi:hypothetical protein
MPQKLFQCDPSLKPAACELAMLRHNVDKQNLRFSRKKAKNPVIKKMIEIVESFLKKKKLICYGGVSINAILPQRKQFYNYDIEIPDYDFFSYDALNHAKELATLFAKKGFHEVEAKAGVHYGTYKVFVNFIGIADVTACDMEIFKNLKKEAIRKDGILYCPPNFLRMSMYLELSRPNGDITRWEKVLKRLTLLNKIYPLKHISCLNHQNTITSPSSPVDKAVKLFLIAKEVVFFGSFAIQQYSQSVMPKRHQKSFARNDFDVLCIDAEKTAMELKALLQEKHGLSDCRIVQQGSIGEIVSSHFQVMYLSSIVTFYLPTACHSYNTIRDEESKKWIKVASIETMMSFYLAFMYTSRPYYDRNRLLCMAQYLFQIQQKNRLEQKGLLKRFSLDCYGNQLTLEDIRNEKTRKYRDLRDEFGKREYEEWFLRYRPND